jgi:esterase/lipase superfamily enzyme
MRRRHELVFSPALGRNVHVWAYGHWGAPLMVFPSAAGMAHEWEAQGMIDAIAPWIYAGKIKVYCPETNVSQTLTNKHVHPGEALRLHQAYEQCVLETLVPAVRHDCRTPDAKIAVAGCSLGAYYAANYAFKHPEIFHYALCMSGRYYLPDHMRQYPAPETYFDTPLWYVPNMEGEALERVRRNTHLTLVCGRGAWEEGCIEETIMLANVCAAKGISHDRDIWGRDVSHGWDWWKRQVRYHLSRVFPLK